MFPFQFLCLSPDDDDTNGGGGGSGDSDSEQTDSTQGGATSKETPDAKTQAIRDGIAIERERTLKKIRGMGIEIVTDADGEPDISETLRKFASKAPEESKKKKETPKDDADAESLEAIRKANERADAAERLANERAMDADLRKYVSADRFHDPADVLQILRSMYDLEYKDDEIRVYNKNKTRARNGRGEYASIEEVISALADKKKYLVKAEYRGGGGGKNENLTGQTPATLDKMPDAKKREYAQEKIKQLG